MILVFALVFALQDIPSYLGAFAFTNASVISEGSIIVRIMCVKGFVKAGIAGSLQDQ